MSSHQAAFATYDEGGLKNGDTTYRGCNAWSRPVGREQQLAEEAAGGHFTFKFVFYK
jgi:hypothetical protein